NEEARITSTLKAYSEFSKASRKNGLLIELIVVCDGCLDKTAKIAKRFKNVKVLEFARRLGKGGGVFAGFNAASGDYLGFVDADNAVTPEEYEKLISAVIESADCVIASRKIEGSRIFESRGEMQKFGSKALNSLAKLLFGLEIHDTQCGAKIFSREAIEKIMPAMRSSSFEFDIEMLWRIKHAGYSIKEVPIIWRGKKEAKFSMLESPKMFFNLVLRRLGA
ncbi:MAG: glycosyltransferase, partial [Nanoarchaeota archaeon]|nr:glycosyltransferase [Nanoarchaeota archaeon]